MARPTDYKAEYTEQARKLCLLGYTDKELADFFNVKEQTINNWKKKHKEFFESIKKGKDVADAEVVESLYNRAKGITYDEVEERVTGDTDKEKKLTKGTKLIRKVTKYIPPDPISAIFWLKNRQPKTWRDKQEVDLSSKDGSMSPKGTTISVADLTDEQLAEIIANNSGGGRERAIIKKKGKA